MSKFCANSTQNHLSAAKRILRYLRGTSYLAFNYETCAGGYLTSYSDADWVDDRHSTSGNAISLAGGAVSCLSKKQATVALSIDKAKPGGCRPTLSAATQEAFWLRRLLADVGKPPEGPTVNS